MTNKSFSLKKLNHADVVWLPDEEITVTAQSDARTRLYNATTLSGNAIQRNIRQLIPFQQRKI